MEFIKTALPEVVKIVPRVFSDERGFFMETWQSKMFCENVVDIEFVQDKASLLDSLQPGQEVTVTFDICGRENNGRYFNNLCRKGWPIFFRRCS